MSYPGVLQEINTTKIRHPTHQFRMNLDGLNELAREVDRGCVAASGVDGTGAMERIG